MYTVLYVLIEKQLINSKINIIGIYNLDEVTLKKDQLEKLHPQMNYEISGPHQVKINQPINDLNFINPPRFPFVGPIIDPNPFPDSPN